MKSRGITALPKSKQRLANTFFDQAAQLIQNRRLELGISQDTLAEALDISTTHLGHLEQGRRRPSILMLILVCDALQIDLSLIPQ